MTLTLHTPQGTRQIPAQPGQTILDALRPRQGQAPHAPCGGRGLCHKCTVLLEEDGETRAVLACRTPVEDGMVVLCGSEGPLTVETALQETIRPDAGLTGYGIACDLGTTTVVCHLVNLTTGQVLATEGAGNTQRSFGADVISRIQASMEGHLEEMTNAIRQQLGDMIRTLCLRAGISEDQLTRMTLAGNTTMCHLLAGLPPDTMGVAPFTPVSLFGMEYAGADLDLPVAGPVFITPGVSSYVGGDITADLLAVGADCAKDPVLLIDVGTNGEMTLGCGDHILCCSTAAGPAFEGAQIRCGMTAAAGAVSAVEWRDGALSLTVIGGGEARGICGSGLIDAVAVMLDLGVLDETGRMLDPEEDDVPEEAAALLAQWEDEPAFRLTDRVAVTQSDVRKLQLGKGAIAAGAQVLLSASGLKYEEIGALLLAGGFGSYIRPESAARIGMIPAPLLGVTRAVGNTAAEGALLALLSQHARVRLAQLREHMHYLELSGRADFTNAYMDEMLFPEDA